MKVSEKCNGDDVAIFSSALNVASVQSAPVDELMLVSEWFHLNKLSLNVDKSKSVFFGFWFNYAEDISQALQPSRRGIAQALLSC